MNLALNLFLQFSSVGCLGSRRISVSSPAGRCLIGGHLANLCLVFSKSLGLLIGSTILSWWAESSLSLLLVEDRLLKVCIQVFITVVITLIKVIIIFVFHLDISLLF